MNDLDKQLKRMVLNDCNNKIIEFNEICNYISQYSNANVFLIPSKYEETITNELKDMIETHHAPITYEIREAENDMITLTLFNFGVMQREQFIDGLMKK